MDHTVTYSSFSISQYAVACISILVPDSMPLTEPVSTARVALLVDGLQSAVFDVSVNLRGADTGVPQHFLEGSDIRTARQ